MKTKKFMGLVEMSEWEKKEISGGFIMPFSPDTCTPEELSFFYVYDPISRMYVERYPDMLF